ncbi:hypothetical protein G3T16_00060 [Kineobactrum salinum]|nr:hypothetical protein G3T16_00060 [Kineobactrum salinum]
MLEQHKSFLAEHRHMVSEDGRSTEVVIVTQDLSQLASYPRSLVASTYRTTKMDIIGASKSFRVDVYEGAVTGNKPPVKQRVRQIPGKYKADIYKYYKSQTLSESANHGDESRTDDRINILKSKWLRVGFPFLIVFCLYIVYKGMSALGSFYGSSDDMASTQQPMQQQGDAPTRAPQRVRHWFDGMSISISFNMGTHPRNIVYRLAFAGPAGSVTMGTNELYRLGYSIEPIDACLVRLVGHGDSRLVMCPGPDTGKRDSIFDI